MPIAWKAWAFFKRDLITDVSYKLSFAFQVVDILVGIGAFYFLSRLLGRGAFRGYELSAFVLFSSLYPILRAIFDAGLYVLGGVMFGLSLARVDLLAVALLFFLSVLAFNSIGILSATFTLVFKRGDPLLWLVAGLSWLLGGVFYPVEVLPRFLQHAGQLLPITHALTGMRAALLRGPPARELLPQIGALAVFGLVGLPVSVLAFHFGVRWANVTGTLSHF